MFHKILSLFSFLCAVPVFSMTILTESISQETTYILSDPDGVVLKEGVKIEAPLIQLFSEDGKIQIEGCLHSPSGAVLLSGKLICVRPSGVIDVSGDSCGGSITLGSDLAQSVVVDQGAMLSANANSEGNGGTIDLFSYMLTHFDGHASVAAYGMEGDGGLIEISSLGDVRYQGSVTLFSSNGKTGQLKLEP